MHWVSGAAICNQYQECFAWDLIGGPQSPLSDCHMGLGLAPTLSDLGDCMEPVVLNDMQLSSGLIVFPIKVSRELENMRLEWALLVPHRFA